MHLAPVISIELFDPHLQLEAEEPEASADAAPQRFASASIHAEIIGTIAAIDRLTAHWQRPPSDPAPDAKARRLGG